MALPLSKSQIERLGVRLVARAEPAPADIDLLHVLLEAYGGVLEGAVARVRTPLEVSPTSRIKSTGTILEKLRRQGGSWLKSTQDIAGMRIVGGSDRREQDTLVGQLLELFENEGRAPKIVDRRMHPSHGYRAVHVIAFPDAVPVEIQVRTRLQHEWADMFEKLADRVGRGIRYGEAPSHWLSADEREAGDPMLRGLYDVAYESRNGTVASAIALADLIAAIEAAEQIAPQAPELVVYRRQVADGLADLRRSIDGMVSSATDVSVGGESGEGLPSGR